VTKILLLIRPKMARAKDPYTAMSYSSATVSWRVNCIVFAIAAKPGSEKDDHLL
jgi:hypothetical protein